MGTLQFQETKGTTVSRVERSHNETYSLSAVSIWTEVFCHYGIETDEMG